MLSDLSELVTKCRHYLSQLPDLLRDGWAISALFICKVGIFAWFEVVAIRKGTNFI
jgi:hypothetical protein